MENRMGPVPSARDPHPYRLGRNFSLGRNKHFQAVYRRGKRQGGRLLVLTYLKSNALKVGFSVSSKLGNAVARNRVRRMLRDDFRHLRPELAPGRYVVSAKVGAEKAAHAQLTRELRHLFDKAGLIRKGGAGA